MIDLKLLREDPDRVRASQRARGEHPGLVDALLDADAARRSAISAADNLRAEQKAASKRVGAAGKDRADERPALLAHAKELAEQVKAAEAEQTTAEQAFTAAHMAVGNVIIDGVPAGGEDDFVVLETVGEPAKLDNPKDHLELGESPAVAAETGGEEVSMAVLAATLTSSVVFFPVMFLYGVSRFLFSALALASNRRAAGSRPCASSCSASVAALRAAASVSARSRVSFFGRPSYR